MRDAVLWSVAAALATLAGCRSFGPPDDYRQAQFLRGSDTARDNLWLNFSKDPDRQRWGMLGLARSEHPEAAASIAFRLNPRITPSPLVRSTAAVALRILGDKRALQDLRAAVSDPNPIVRADVVSAIGALGDERDESLLLSLLRGDRDPRVRLEAVGALERVGGEAAVRELIARIHDRDESVAFAAHRALARMTGQDLPPRQYDWKTWLETQAPARGELTAGSDR